MMMMMKNPIILVACTLLLSSLVMASSNTYSPDACCFQFIKTRLPKLKVVSYKYIDDMCPLNGVIFTMLSGSQLCVNPSLDWVQNIIKYVESKK